MQMINALVKTQHVLCVIWNFWPQLQILWGGGAADPPDPALPSPCALLEIQRITINAAMENMD